MMSRDHEWMFYEVMWRAKSRGIPYPFPWWVQQYFRCWPDFFDGGLFDSKEAAFAANAFYRYWHMIGVKDAQQESLVGQAGEIEPVYDKYILLFFLFEPATRQLHFPQTAGAIDQSLSNGYLPIITTAYQSPIGIEVVQQASCAVVGNRNRSVAVVRLRARLTDQAPHVTWLCTAITPVGPTGFQRRDKAGRFMGDRRLTSVRYVQDAQAIKVPGSWGPIFDTPPTHWGTYGNPGNHNPDFYIEHGPYQDLITSGNLNGQDAAVDLVAGLCSAVLAWPMELTAENPTHRLDIKLPIDDYWGRDDLALLQSANPVALVDATSSWWTKKLNQSGLQMSLPPAITHFYDLFRTCRANLLILSDDGQIHPGPTVYDSFWIRDSSVEGIACALSGDQNLAERQFGQHYPRSFNLSYETIGPASAYGFFGGEHEKNDREWDSNGQALWALGRFDRIRGRARGFGEEMFVPYVVEGARWLRDNRGAYGLLHSGWSAEHLGDKHQPHYWDDFGAIAGLWEAAKLGERISAQQTDEIWSIFHAVRNATADSIRWVLAEQRRRSFWETFIPTGPGDVGRLDSTMIGTLAYFHPCRLYMGAKLGDDIDQAARHTLETIQAHFVKGGFCHDSAWNCFGPYLTLQLAHTHLLVGNIGQMAQCLRWTAEDAAFAEVGRIANNDPWQVVLGAWNEQHCYPIATNFAEFPDRSWYMGDIPHGWACAEFQLLLRDMLFFEADEDDNPHIYLAPGILPGWLGDAQTVEVSGAPTIFGDVFGYRLTHFRASQTVNVHITTQMPDSVSYVFPCQFGAVRSLVVNGDEMPVGGNDVYLPAGTLEATIAYY
jgi:hypothetical protein